MKKFILLSLTALLSVSLFLTGCGDAEGGAAGVAGPPAPAVISGNITAEALQILVDGGNPILFANASEIGAGYVDLKGASITAAAAVTFNSGGVTLNAAKASIAIKEGGSIVTSNAVIVIPATEPAWVALATGTGILASQASLADISKNTDDSKAFTVETLTVASDGKVTGLSNVTLTALLGNVAKLVVSGAYETAEAEASIATKVVPLGSITHTGATSLALPAKVYGDVATAGASVSVAAATVIKGGLTASLAAGVTIATSDNAIEIGGDLKTTGATGALTVSGTGAITVKGDVEVKGAASLGGDLTVSGKADFDGALANTAAVTLSVGADSTITGVVTSGTGGLTIAGAGLVDVEHASGPTLTAALSIASTGGVRFTKLVTGTGGNTVTLAKALVAAGDAASPISLAVANTGIELGEGDTIALENEGSITIASGGKIAIGAFADIETAGSWTAATGTGEYLVIKATDAEAYIGTHKLDGTTATTGGTLTVATAGTITMKTGEMLAIGGKTEIALGGVGAKVGSIVLPNGTAAVIAFTAPGAKISTGNPAGNVVATVGGGIKANNGSVGAKLEVRSSAVSGSGLKLGTITPADDATFEGGDSAISGPTSSGATSIDGLLTVTAG